MQPTRENQMRMLDALLQQEMERQRRLRTTQASGPELSLDEQYVRDLRDIVAEEEMARGGIYPRTQTTHEAVAGMLAPVMQSASETVGLPISERSAYLSADKVAGLLDLLPVVGGVMSADQARRDIGSGDYGDAALNTAFALADLVPAVAAARKGVKPAVAGMREGMIDVADHPIARDYFARNLRAAQASHGPIGRSVDVYSPAEYEGMRMAMRPEGDAGFAIKPTGEIVSVLKHKGSDFRDFGASALRRAEPDDGYWLNAFDTALTGIYGKGGFQPVSRLPFNEDIARSDWGNEATDAFMAANAKYSGGRPDLVFMARNPAATEPVVQGRGGLLTDDWDEATRLLDDELRRLGYR